MSFFSKFLIAGFILFVLISRYDTFSQVPVKKSENKVVIEGKIYFIHIVKPGQTLYSVSKAYGVAEKDIAIENPGVYSGLQVGQVLKIPAEVPVIISNQPIDTVNFITHTLSEGETLYSLSRKYNIPVEKVEEANPGIDVTDLSIGQKILIPRLNTVRSEENFELHKVRRRETLYSLSRRYGVTEEDIKRFNPELQWGELQTGQVIRIPKTDFLAAENKTLEDEGLVIDSLAFDIQGEKDMPDYLDSLGLEEIALKDYSDYLKDFNRRTLNVAFMIPFNYRIVKDTLVVPEDEKLSEEEEEKKKEEESLPKSINFLEFFEGSLLALDSLRKEGITVNVQYFDTNRSPLKVREIMETPFFRDVDLIIGPFYAYNVEIVSEYSRENRIPLISPFYDGRDLTDRNPFLFQVNPSYRTEYSRAAEVLARNYDKNFVFVYRDDSTKFHEIDFFRTSLLDNLQDYIHSENVVIKEIVYENAAKANLSEDFSHALSRDKKNIVIIPENNEAFVSTVITQLYFQLQDFEIEVFGLPYFHEFKNITYQYYHDLKLNYLSSFYYDYEDEQIQSFLKLYTESFNAEPRLATKKGCPYAFAGYDITYFFIRKIFNEKNRFITGLNDNKIDILLPQFRFIRNTLYGGFENKSLKLVSFTEDYGVLAKDVEDLEYPRKYEFPDIFRFEYSNDEIK